MQTKSKVDFNEKLISEAYLEPSQTSKVAKIDFFAKTVEGFQLLTFFAK